MIVAGIDKESQAPAMTAMPIQPITTTTATATATAAKGTAVPNIDAMIDYLAPRITGETRAGIKSYLLLTKKAMFDRMPDVPEGMRKEWDRHFDAILYSSFSPYIDFTLISMVSEILRRIVPLCKTYEAAHIDHLSEIRRYDIVNYITDSLASETKIVIGDNARIERAIGDQIQPNCFDTCQNPRCRKKAVYFVSVQTRSGDEATTLMYECLACGTKWTER